MRRYQIAITSGVMIGVLLVCHGVQAVQPPSISISVPETGVYYGDPILLEVRLTFTSPVISRATDNVQDAFKLEFPELQVTRRSPVGDHSVIYRLPSIRCVSQDKEGLGYAANIVIWWEMCEVEEKREGRLVFESPGTYELALSGARDSVSNTLLVNVKPSALGEKSLALLSEPDDFRFLARGVDAGPLTVKRLEDLAQQYPDSLLARMATARLGIEYSRRLEEKYPNGEEFIQRSKRGEINEPLVAKAQSNLSQGYELPSEFPIRETVVNRLATTEFIVGNYTKAFSLLDELAAKYPRGEYGSRATRTKAELMSFSDVVSQQPEGPLPSSSRTWILITVILLIAVLSSCYVFVVRGRLGGQKP